MQKCADDGCRTKKTSACLVTQSLEILGGGHDPVGVSSQPIKFFSTASDRTCVRQKTENAFAFWFSVFYARTVFYIYTYSFVLPDICTSHFRVYNSDILYCILGTTSPAFLEEYSGTLLIWLVCAC
jgi:hypothetical protein